MDSLRILWGWLSRLHTVCECVSVSVCDAREFTHLHNLLGFLCHYHQILWLDYQMSSLSRKIPKDPGVKWTFFSGFVTFQWLSVFFFFCWHDVYHDRLYYFPYLSLFVAFLFQFSFYFSFFFVCVCVCVCVFMAVSSTRTTIHFWQYPREESREPVVTPRTFFALITPSIGNLLHDSLDDARRFSKIPRNANGFLCQGSLHW